MPLHSRLTSRARDLRQSTTDAEKMLWSRLRGKQLDDCKFRRQQPIGQYIVDFVCFEKKLVIEADGSQHADSEIDRVRDSWLHGEGFTILRFWNTEILTNTDGVIETIYRVLAASPSPSPSQKGGEPALLPKP